MPLDQREIDGANGYSDQPEACRGLRDLEARRFIDPGSRGAHLHSIRSHTSQRRIANSLSHCTSRILGKTCLVEGHYTTPSRLYVLRGLRAALAPPMGKNFPSSKQHPQARRIPIRGVLQRTCTFWESATVQTTSQGECNQSNDALLASPVRQRPVSDDGNPRCRVDLQTP